ncbi:transcriptional regulator [Acinetobacter oleivorans]|uniref:transcriptional regulator n=1 Tax=Acinetobacter oleivorans TaxID=1148157 RepID=UPI003A8AB700
MFYNWDSDRAEQNINTLCDQVDNVEIVQYKRSLDLGNIPVNKAYEMDAVHLYVDILNLNELLVTTSGNETEYSHKRAIRFFDSHFRAIRFILEKTDCIFVDFHNQRLHAVIPRPYGTDEDEKKRLDRAVAISDLIIKVAEQQREISGDETIPASKIRIGIDSGLALTVNNGRKKHREPLFLGNPANHAAKHSSGKSQGIYLTANARKILGLVEALDTKKTKLTVDEIISSVERAAIDKEVTQEQVVDEVCTDIKLLKDFGFTRTTPPLKDLDFTSLYYKSAKRQEILSIYADIDGFTNFVSNNLDTIEGKENIVRCLHVLRSEMDACLSQDFAGRRVRFIGDCIHGILCEGTSKDTNMNNTADVGTEAVGGIRSSFLLSLDLLEERFDIDISELGLAIGYEIGETSLTRVGKKGQSTRISLGISTINAEEEQRKCTGNAETRIGNKAYENLSTTYKDLFSNRSASDLTFETVKGANIQNEAKQKESIYDSAYSFNNSNVKAHATVK